jgi:hypothetical protein
MARGVLHRNGCRAIPPSSEPALYAVEQMRAGDAAFGCAVCRPEPLARREIEPEDVFDLFYGALSFLDQFSSILRERGREYRQSNRAAAWVRRFEQILATLGQPDSGHTQVSSRATSVPIVSISP